jgi:hypothetical protein
VLFRSLLIYVQNSTCCGSYGTWHGGACVHHVKPSQYLPWSSIFIDWYLYLFSLSFSSSCRHFGPIPADDSVSPLCVASAAELLMSHRTMVIFSFRFSCQRVLVLVPAGKPASGPLPRSQRVCMLVVSFRRRMGYRCQHKQRPSARLILSRIPSIPSTQWLFFAC